MLAKLLLLLVTLNKVIAGALWKYWADS